MNILKIDIPTASNEELARAYEEETDNWEKSKLQDEIHRRLAAQRSAENNPFNPRTDVSADARFLWKNLFIWFWIIPVLAILVAWLVRSA
jgi:type VI protein secretion system component VasF